MDWHVLPLIAVAVFIVTDVVSGILKAAMQHDLNSAKAREGVYHKSAYILIVVCSLAVEWAMGFMDLGFDVPITTASCVYISLTEIMSILENVTVLNPDLAGTKLLGLFSVVADKKEDGR